MTVGVEGSGPDFVARVAAEIRRVAGELGKPVMQLARRDFLAASQIGYAFEKAGTWHQLKKLAASESGEHAPSVPALREGARQALNHTAKLERRIGRADWFADRLDSCLARALEAQPIVPAEVRKPPSLSKQAKAATTLTCVLSDLHFGVSVDPVEAMGSEYSPRTACRRLALMAEQVCDWKPEKRDTTELVVLLNGDIIEGEIHLEDHLIDPLAQQIDTAARALVSFIDHVRAHFGVVRVIGVPGNHGRTKRNPSRAISQKWNSHEAAIFLGLEMAYRAHDDVIVEVPRAAIAHYRTPGGHLVAATHGDTEPTTANPGKGISTARMAEKLRAIDAARILPAPIDVIVQGHWHQPCAFMTPHGAWSVTNGSLIGGSAFSFSGAGVYDPEPAQVLFESVAGFPFGDMRTVLVRRADGRADLDSIVPTPAQWR